LTFGSRSALRQLTEADSGSSGTSPPRSSAADLLHSPRLVDVPVQAHHRLVTLDRVADHMAGSTLAYRRTFLGRGYELPFVCTGLTENMHFATGITGGPIYLETDAVLEPVDEGTRVTTTYRGESRGFFKLAEPLIIRLSKKHWETATENLRELLEDRAL
jgi:hypothetical protein